MRAKIEQCATTVLMPRVIPLWTPIQPQDLTRPQTALRRGIGTASKQGSAPVSHRRSEKKSPRETETRATKHAKAQKVRYSR